MYSTLYSGADGEKKEEYDGLFRYRYKVVEATMGRCLCRRFKGQFGKLSTVHVVPVPHHTYHLPVLSISLRTSRWERVAVVLAEVVKST